MTESQKHLARLGLILLGGAVLGAVVLPHGYKSFGAGLGMFGSFIWAQGAGYGLYA